MSQFLDLFEMPISSIQKVGDWGPDDKPRGYDKASIGILNSERGIEKIKHLWRRVDHEFDIFLVRSAKGWNHTEVGEVDEAFIRKTLELDVPLNSDHATIFFTNNKGAEKVPMTGWTMAHRFGHATRRSRDWGMADVWKRFDRGYADVLTEIGQCYGVTTTTARDWGYGANDNYAEKAAIRRGIAHALGTMKSARDKNLRNDTEFLFELLAQFMVTGKCTLNRDLPRQIATRYAWGHPQGPWKRHEAGIIHEIEYFEQMASETCREIVDHAIGRIYVM